ncbi:MAG TPA: antibiotic biosynthesis monooxygenase [Ktedonobacteraceae bacterium]|nr:antibiotic biosynthesis monooxygenase [Ktedonobacteraceae bacterium]
MYGTVAYCRAKPGTERQLLDIMRAFETAEVPGVVASYVYRMDTDANDYYVAVVFANREAYMANAMSAGQDERYRQLLDLMDAVPEWHDGEVVYALESARR